jgi:hypothetical protein
MIITIIVIENMNYGRCLHYIQFPAEYATQIYLKSSI